MKKIIFALMVLVPLQVYAQNGEKNFIDQNYIEVTGKSEMEISPDMIYLQIILNEKDTKNKIPVMELESKMIEKLKQIGIDITKDLLIKDISSNFKKYLLAQNEVLLSKEYQLLVHDGKTASQVFLELEKIGISNVSVDRVDHSNIVQLRKDVKVSAIKAAKEKAELLTSAIGQSIGKALFIQEIEPRIYDARNENMVIRGYKSNSGDLSMPLDFDFEKIKIEYSIMCRFELKVW